MWPPWPGRGIVVALHDLAMTLWTGRASVCPTCPPPSPRDPAVPLRPPLDRVVKGVGHIGHDEAIEAGGREFDARPEHYVGWVFSPTRQPVRFSHPNMPFFQNSEFI